MAGPGPSVWKALAAGGVVLIAAALLSGESAAAALGRIALGAVALHWALTVYGPTAALASSALAAFAMAPIAGPEGVGWELFALAQLLTAYALLRCLLDPTVQRVAGSAAALAAALLTGAVVHRGAGAGRWLALFSVAVAVSRVMTAEPHEARSRVAQASAVSIVLVWLAAVALLAVLQPLIPLAAPEEYVQMHHVAVLRIVTTQAADAASSVLRYLGIPLLLALLRPWRRERRYADTTVAAALACCAVPTWEAAEAAGHGLAGLAAVTTLLALIGAACWDAATPPWRRQTATALLALQVALLIASPPPRPSADTVQTARPAVPALGFVR